MLYARENNLTMNEEPPIKHDLDEIRIWIKNNRLPINCDDFLSAWNLFGDIAAIYRYDHEEFESLTQTSIDEYNKLFWGNNLKALRGSHPKYFPIWRDIEKERIAKVMQKGFRLLNANVKLYA